MSICPICHEVFRYCPHMLEEAFGICNALRAELELSRKIADEAIKQNEILTEELNVWKPGSITASLMVDELRKQLEDVKDVALRVLNKLNEFDYTESGITWEIKSAITEINRIGGMNE